MIKLFLAITILASSFLTLAETRINIRVKNTPIGSYFVLFDESLEGNERVGLIGQSYFNDKGIFVVNNGFRDGFKVISIIVKDKNSGNVSLKKEIVVGVNSETCDNVNVYDWLIECGVYRN